MKVLCFGKSKERVTARCEALERAGHSSRWAMDLEAANAAAAQDRFDALVLGQQVPEEDRNQVARELRARNPQLIIVMLYAGSIRSTELADAILNVDGDINDLVQTLAFLEKRRAQRSISALRRSAH